MHRIVPTLFLGLVLVSGCENKAERQNAEKQPNVKLAGNQQAGEASTAMRSPDNFVIIPGKQVGSVTATSSEAELKALLGDENVTRDSVYLGEGDMTIGTTLFRGTPDQAQILWKNTDTFSNPETVLLRPSKEKPGTAGAQTQWVLDSGLKMGNTLKEVEKINGRSFMLYGFGWDRGGTVSNWQGGALQPNGSLSYLSLVFDPATDTESGTKPIEQVLGDSEFSSSHPSMQKINPTVVEIRVRLN